MSFTDVFFSIFTPYGMMIITLGVLIGILGGALPGVSNTMTVALVAMAASTMDPLWGITFMGAAQVGSNYGGSISATLLNIPGTPAAAATALEGFPLARQGEAATALGLNAVSSFMGNSISVILLLLSMPLMAVLAFSFGPWEFFWFSMFGVVICANLSRANFIKGLLAALLGLFLSTMGQDPLYGTHRFTFGVTYLMGGIALIPAMVGLFGMSEVFTTLTDIQAESIKYKKSVLLPFGLWWKYRWMGLRVAILGFIIGCIPGVGANIASWVGYDHAKTSSKEPHKFGSGAYEGLIGSETGNNACIPGTYGPMLTLGVPGDAATAIALGVLMLHGIQPGPTFFGKNPHWLWQIAIALFLSGIVFLIIGSLSGRAILKAMTIPMPAIIAGVAVLCVIGSYGIYLRLADVYVMFVFGLLGLFMKAYGYPLAPLILGLILGGPLGDPSFRRALIVARGDLSTFFTRPVSMVLVSLLLLIVVKDYLLPPLQKCLARAKTRV